MTLDAESWVPEQVVEGVPLAAHTTLAVGGPARYFATCADAAALAELQTWSRDSGVPMLVLGAGSNVLVSDRGFDGLVVAMSGGGITFERQGEEVLVQADAGVEWDELVRRTVEEGLGGLECLSGIPGRVGAAPMQNIGAYGQEVAETIATIEVLERRLEHRLERRLEHRLAGHTALRQRLAGADCGFGYRTSHFKSRWCGRYLVTRVDFRLRPTQQGKVTYPDLRRRLGMTSGGASPDLAAVRSAVLAVRRSKSMVIDAQDPNRRSAGSFFTNPIVSSEVAADVRRRSRVEPPAFPAGEGRVKIPAAWLIEQAGFARGYELGRAGLSTRHTLALINRGGATARELLALAAEIRFRVRDVFGVTLVPEPVFVGFDQSVEALLNHEEAQ